MTSSVAVRRHLPSLRLTAVFVLLGFVPLIILTYSSLALAHRAVTAEVNARVSSIAASASTNAAGVLDSLEVTLGAFAAQPQLAAAMSDGRDSAELTAALRQLRRSRPEFSAVALTDPAGTVTAVLPPSPSSIGADRSYRDWYRGAISSQLPYVSEAYETGLLSRPRVVTVAVQVRTRGPETSDRRVVGVVAALYDLATLQHVTDQFAHHQGVGITFTDRHGVVLAAPGAQRAGLVSLRGDPRVRAALRGDAGARTVTGARGPLLSAYTAVPRLGWTVIAEVPERAAFASLRRLTVTVLTVASLLAAALVIGLGVASRAEKRRRDAEGELAERAAALAISERQFRAAFTHAPGGMVRLSDEGVILEANRALHEMLGVAPGALPGRSLGELIDPQDAVLTLGRLGGLVGTENATVRIETRLLHADGHQVWTVMSAARLESAEHVPYTLGQIVDISDRKANEGRLRRQALQDPLTGLANRLLLEERLDHALARQTRQPPRMAVLFIDLDGFKTVNDTCGHKVGDEVLSEVAARLGLVVRPGDTVARLGGDEFVVLCEDLPEPAMDVATGLANRILRTLQDPFHPGDRQLHLSASIGISQPTTSTATAADLLAQADAAMYRAKQEGKACHRIFNQSMTDLATVATTTWELLDTALVQDRLRLHYQPVVDLHTGRVIGAEALLRLIGQHGELLCPAAFLPAAEAHGHIVGFGAWALTEACRQAAEWKAGLPEDREFGIGVNMTAKEIEDPGLADRVRAALIETGLPPDALIIELTESAFLRDLPSSRATLKRLRRLGVKIALDDFGTGYSSLSYLRRIPIDIIKLDRTFVDDLLGDAEHSRVTRALIELAHNLGAVVVAEGVEQPAQVTALIQQSCRFAQGYLMSRPVDPHQFHALLHQQLIPARRSPAAPAASAATAPANAS
jgi:diguanylate cyclase (GGDEF)-like protein/PAS domain S-box-containing protein